MIFQDFGPFYLQPLRGYIVQRIECCGILLALLVIALIFGVYIFGEQATGFVARLASRFDRHFRVRPHAHGGAYPCIGPLVVENPDFRAVGHYPELQATTVQQLVHSGFRLGLFYFGVGEGSGDSGHFSGTLEWCVCIVPLKKRDLLVSARKL